MKFRHYLYCEGRDIFKAFTTVRLLAVRFRITTTRNYNFDFLFSVLVVHVIKTWLLCGFETIRWYSG